MSMSMTKSLIDYNYDKGIQLLRRQLLTEIVIDDTIKELLTYIIYNEPITLYRISKSTRFAISTVYKKARRMIQYGLIRPLNINGNNNERGIYVSTVKGLLTCLALNCVSDKSIIINKICQKWRLRSYCCQRIASIIHALPMLISIDSGIIRMLDDPKAIMISILEHRDQLEPLINDHELFNDVINTAMHYLISRLIIDGGVITKSSILVGNDKFVVNISLDGVAHIYACKLCEKSCTGMRILIHGTKCVLLNEIRELGIDNILR